MSSHPNSLANLNRSGRIPGSLSKITKASKELMATAYYHFVKDPIFHDRWLKILKNTDDQTFLSATDRVLKFLSVSTPKIEINDNSQHLTINKEGAEFRAMSKDDRISYLKDLLGDVNK